MTPTMDLGLSIRLSMFELRETASGDWDIFLGPPARARAETGGADQWVLKRRKLSGLARVNKVTSASLGYPLSVFNKNSTLRSQALKKKKGWQSQSQWRIPRVPGDFSTQEIFSLLRALTYEAEQTLDLPRHGTARACPWLSTASVAGSVRRGRGGDLYSQRRS